MYDDVYLGSIYLGLWDEDFRFCLCGDCFGFEIRDDFDDGVWFLVLIEVEVEFDLLIEGEFVGVEVVDECLVDDGDLEVVLVIGWIEVVFFECVNV